jgi:hypothetical protein
MCNLYSLTKGQQTIREFARAMRDRTGNLPSLPGIFPHYAAPTVRNQPDGRELAMAATGARAARPSLLTGMVFDETGERLTPTHAVKKGTRYRYYVSTSLITGAERTRSSGWRIPAGNFEAVVIDKLPAFLADPRAILDVANNEPPNGSGWSQLIERSRQIAAEPGGYAPGKVKAMLMTLLCRVEIKSECIEITLSRGRLIELLVGSIDLKTQHFPSFNRGGPRAPAQNNREFFDFGPIFRAMVVKTA